MNQLRHVRFLRDTDGLLALMDRHRAIVAPKFASVIETFERHLAGTGVASWVVPRGGYFITLDVLDGCAKEVVRLATEAGVALTPAGATYPFGRDPRDRNIRIAPTFPDLAPLSHGRRRRRAQRAPQCGDGAAETAGGAGVADTWTRTARDERRTNTDAIERRTEKREVYNLTST